MIKQYKINTIWFFAIFAHTTIFPFLEDNQIKQCANLAQHFSNKIVSQKIERKLYTLNTLKNLISELEEKLATNFDHSTYIELHNFYKDLYEQAWEEFNDNFHQSTGYALLKPFKNGYSYFFDSTSSGQNHAERIKKSTRRMFDYLFNYTSSQCMFYDEHEENCKKEYHLYPYRELIIKYFLTILACGESSGAIKVSYSNAEKLQLIDDAYREICKVCPQLEEIARYPNTLSVEDNTDPIKQKKEFRKLNRSVTSCRKPFKENIIPGVVVFENETNFVFKNASELKEVGIALKNVGVAILCIGGGMFFFSGRKQFGGALHGIGSFTQESADLMKNGDPRELKVFLFGNGGEDIGKVQEIVDQSLAPIRETLTRFNLALHGGEETRGVMGELSDGIGNINNGVNKISNGVSAIHKGVDNTFGKESEDGPFINGTLQRIEQQLLGPGGTTKQLKALLNAIETLVGEPVKIVIPPNGSEKGEEEEEEREETKQASLNQMVASISALLEARGTILLKQTLETRPLTNEEREDLAFGKLERKRQEQELEEKAKKGEVSSRKKSKAKKSKEEEKPDNRWFAGWRAQQE